MKRTRSLSCKGKQKNHETRGDAYDAMNSFFSRNYGGVVSPNASVYPCKDHFHWGHSRDRKR